MEREREREREGEGEGERATWDLETGKPSYSNSHKEWEKQTQQNPRMVDILESLDPTMFR